MYRSSDTDSHTVRRGKTKRKSIRRGRRRTVELRGRGLTQPQIPRREGETVPHAQPIARATSRAIFRAQTRASDKWRNRQAPTAHFAAKLRAICSARKIRRHTRLTKRVPARVGVPPKRAGERSNKIGSASTNTTTPRSGT